MVCVDLRGVNGCIGKRLGQKVNFIYAHGMCGEQTTAGKYITPWREKKVTFHSNKCISPRRPFYNKTNPCGSVSKGENRHQLLLADRRENPKTTQNLFKMISNEETVSTTPQSRISRLISTMRQCVEEKCMNLKTIGFFGRASSIRHLVMHKPWV